MRRKLSRTKRRNWSCAGHVERADLRGGGLTQRDIKRHLTDAGHAVRFEGSMYVGHYAVWVDTCDKRKLARVQRYLGVA